MSDDATALHTEALMAEKRIILPPQELVAQANVSPKQYEQAIKQGETDLEGYWAEAAQELDWFKKWDRVLDDSNKPFFKWFVNGQCNIVHNALDRHMNTSIKDKTAIIFEGERGDTAKFTYYELYIQVNKFTNVLRKLGIHKGDRVAIYLPNIPEIAIAMLACAKLGAVHNVVYAGFSAAALRERISNSAARVVVTADGFFRRGKVVSLKPVVDEALVGCDTVERVIVVKRAGQQIDMSDGRCLWYHELMQTASGEAATEIMDSEDMLFLLYTSGTTAKPKGIVHVHGGYMVGINRTLKWVFDIKPTDIYWCAADPGWITGHSYIIYAPLIVGTTTVMYEGHPIHPAEDRMWQIIEKHRISILYTSPTTIRMLMGFGSEPLQKYAMNSLRLLGSVGEPINPEAWMWYYDNVGHGRCPIMDTWWQTETGMFMVTPLPVSKLKPGSATKPFPGVQAEVVDKLGNPVPPGKGGFLAIKAPWPAMLRTLYNEDEKYKEVYWNIIPGYYVAGDVVNKDEDGYFWFQGRADDVLNISGHRIATAEIESALVSHPVVAEAAAIGIPDKIRGEVAKAFVILKQGVAGNSELTNELLRHIRRELGPIVVMGGINYVESLPKTRSGKIMRRVLKAQETGKDLGDLTTLAD
jgi:acetyl-CoA synthetase